MDVVPRFAEQVGIVIGELPPVHGHEEADPHPTRLQTALRRWVDEEHQVR